MTVKLRCAVCCPSQPSSCLSPSPPPPQKKQVRLDSGDIILFNGQKLFHSVDKIITGTCPAFWENKTIDNQGYARFNLQFRDSRNWRRGLLG